MGFRQRPRGTGGGGPLFAAPDLTAAARSWASTARGPGTTARGGRTVDRDKPRHAGLFEAIRRLDTVLDAADRRALADWIRSEYEREYHFDDVPLGFVSACYLGPPYVDHRLDLTASIVDHFAPGQAMPPPFDNARSWVRSGAYEFVEVYLSGNVIAVRPDGTPVHSDPQEQQ